MSVNNNACLLIALACIACVRCNGVSDRAGGRVDAASGGEGACDAGESSRTFYEDLDRDGFGAPGAGGMHGCYSRAPLGFSLNARDCDDADATKQAERFVDRDADGYGDAIASCVGTTEAGYVERAGDCDDSDATRSPAATETWFDGSDLDCDGQDDPGGCIAAPGVDSASYADGEVLELPSLDALVIERHADCAGADLYFAIVGACHLCGGGSSTLVIANRGTEASQLRIESNREILEPDFVLEPQHASAPLVIELDSPGSTLRISTRGGVTDCNPANNAREVEVGFTDCQ